MCTSSSCGDSGDTGDTGDAADGVGSDGSPGSTPFIATWNDGKFTLENDFLFGKPKTNVSLDFEVAKKKYESGNNSGDLYLIQNKIEAKNSEIVFQVREIEPEVSYIDKLEIAYFQKKENFAYFTTSDHKNVIAIEKEELLSQKVEQNISHNTGIKNTEVTNDFLKRFSSLVHGADLKNMKPVTLLTGETLQMNISSIRNDNDEETYLLLESVYRDWTLGEIFKENSFSLQDEKWMGLNFSLLRPVKILGLSLLFSLSYLGINLGGQITNKGSANPNDGGDSYESILSKAFDLNSAHADIPVSGRSLVVSFYDNTTNASQIIDIIEPRYRRPSPCLVKIPAHAKANGKISLEIKATKKHKVTCAQLLVVKKKVIVPFETLNLNSAYHSRLKKDFSKELKEKDRDYLVTWPGDIVELKYELPFKKENIDSFGFVLKAEGFYTSASKETQEELGDWVSKLDKESYSFLKEMYKTRTTKNKRMISIA